jgi:hypothetical protein
MAHIRRQTIKGKNVIYQTQHGNALTPAEKRATNTAKARGNAKGKQFVKQPKKVAQKTKGYR